MPERLRVLPTIAADNPLRWVALRIAPAREFSVTDQLERDGYAPYCPVARKWTFWSGTRRLREKEVRQYPVFSGYVFCGLADNQEASRYMAPGVEEVLGDSSGPVLIPTAAILEVNRRELAGEWDGTRSYREKSPYKPGTAVSVVDGAFVGLGGKVDSLISERRILLLVELFGRQTRVIVDTGQLKPNM